MNDRAFPVAAPAGLPANQLPRELTYFGPEPVGHERSLFQQLSALLRVLIRWRWLFLAILIGTTLLAGLFAAMQTPLYRATATLELNPAPGKVVASEEADEPRQTDRDFLALQIGLTKSRAVAERVARKLNLGRDEAFLGQPAPPGASAANAVGALMDGFKASGTTSDRIMQVSFVHPNPQVAARVVNAFAEEAIDSSFERGHEMTARSRAFLQRRLEATRQELERSERQLIGYARSANIVNVVAQDAPTSGDSAGGTLLSSNLLALNAQLADAQNARIVAQQRYAQASASAQSAMATDSTVQTLQSQRAQLQAEYDQKLSRYEPVHPEMVSLRSRLEGLDRQIRQASGRTSSTVSGQLRAEFVAAQNRERLLEGRISQLESQLLDLNDRGVRYTILKRAVDANRAMYNALLERLGQENSSATKTSSVALIDTATVPGAPISPNVPRALILGLIGGMILGTAGAAAAEAWYDTINAPEDLRDSLGLPVLGVIPKTQAERKVDDDLQDPRSPVSEAYHATRASLQYLGAGGPPKSILFTSTRAQEGKTSSVIAIAADFISVGKRVVVIDADLRMPSLRGPGGPIGLSNVLSGAALLADALQETGTPELYLLPAGPIPPNPTVLLDGPVLSEMLRRLESEFDLVIIDGPPVLGLADALLLARVAEATVLIVESGKIRRRAASESARRIEQSGGALVGAILTKFDQKSHGYGYGYGYEYKYSGEIRTRALIGPPAEQPPPQHQSA